MDIHADSSVPAATVVHTELGWDAVCECGYQATDLIVEATAKIVVTCHCQATGHRLLAA